jgi:cellulose synthase/poly-beta-1,6-N-acetylglucosamine synthase-like glycosyltransferase
VIAIELSLNVIAILLLIPVVVIFFQVTFAYLPTSREVISLPALTRIAVLVPAHDEAGGIASTIDSILPQLKSGDRLLIVADNCSDNTARIASEKGAEVIERQDLKNRGKGFALDYGIQFLSRDPPEVVVIVDADCTVEENSLSKLVAYSLKHDRPVQCLDLMLSPTGAGLKAKIAEFAWVVKNQVRPLGYARLGLPCQLMGTGMAFPWSAISNINLANGNLVEDMKLGIDLTKSGRAPLFYENALVTSYFPSASEDRSSQRTRWEHGHLTMIFSQVPRLIVQGIVNGNIDLLAITLDLCVPPLALLVLMQIGFLVIAAFAYTAGMSYLPFLIAECSLAILALAVLLAWWGWGRHIISLISFLLIPIYVISKIPHYLKFLFNRQKQWVRTGRKK